MAWAVWCCWAYERLVVAELCVLKLPKCQEQCVFPTLIGCHLQIWLLGMTTKAAKTNDGFAL